jgi:hypothetical protein
MGDGATSEGDDDAAEEIQPAARRNRAAGGKRGEGERAIRARRGVGVAMGGIGVGGI